MKYKKLLELIARAIMHKRKKSSLKEEIVREAKEIQKKRTELSIVEKRSMLKKIYKRILSGTPYADNISVFLKMIDEVPEEYLNYELGMNLDKAMVMVDELIRGKGDFTETEMQNIGNIVAGVGIPAIEKHATGVAKLEKGAAKFGSTAMNRNIKELLTSLKQRRGALALPSSTLGQEPAVISKALTREDKLALQDKIKNRLGMIFKSKLAGGTEFARLASQIKSAGVNLNRLAGSLTNIMADAKSYVDAKKKATTLGIEFEQGEDLFRSMFKAAQKKREEAKVKVKKSKSFDKDREKEYKK